VSNTDADTDGHVHIYSAAEMGDNTEFFKGKRILVTGVGSGIGRCLAKALSEFGAEVHGMTKTATKLDSLRAECPSVKTYCVDLTDFGKLRAVLEGLPVMDGVVNNAGVGMHAPFLEATEEQFDGTFGANLKAAFVVAQCAARKMVSEKRGGCIVNVSSQASMKAIAEHAFYAASKAGMDMMTKVMALELGKHNIRVNAVNPTVVLTELGRAHWGNPELGKPMLEKIPLGRFAEEKEVVNVILFMLSDNSSMVTGIAMPVDGGFTC